MKLQSFEEFLEEQTLDEGAVSVSDTSYQGAHGKKPSGTGNWMFSKHQSHDFSKHPKEDLFQHNGTYSAAKKAAVKHFKAQGHTGTIHTQS
jgi:hypothetical protein